MANQVEFTANQLASLDLLIAEKKVNPDFLDDIKNILEGATAALAGFAQAGGLGFATENLGGNSAGNPLDVVKNASLEDLIALRNNAILKT